MIALTFDDALLNTYEVAFPIMNKYRVRGTLFVPTIVFTDGKHVRSDRAPHMTMNQAKELQEAGWEIGSHSHSHPRFDKLTLAEAEWELKESKANLKGWGFKPKTFAFPYGHGFYTKLQVNLAFQYYERVRTVTNKNPQLKLTYGIPIDDYPPQNVSGIFVIHLVKDIKGFEKWIRWLGDENG